MITKIDTNTLQVVETIKGLGTGFSPMSLELVADANTALLYIEFDSSQFNGSIPQIACEPRGRVIRVPDTYDPETRTYSGTWTPSGVDFHTTTTAIKTASYD